MNGNSGMQADMFAKYFPGDPWTIEYVPTDEQSAAMTAHAQSHAQSDEELETFLQMLGIIPSESFVNPNARDAWTKKPTRIVTERLCGRGHLRSEHSYFTPNGKRVCRACKRVTDALRKEKARAAA